MPEPTSTKGVSPPIPDEDRAIRERVRELTSQVLQQGRVDTDAVRDVVRAVTGQTTSTLPPLLKRGNCSPIRCGLDEALLQSASAAHDALQQLAARGKDFTDNDLKDALVSLRKLEEDYVALPAALPRR